MLQSIFLPFLAILLAEMFDKSQLSLLILSTKTKHHLQLFLGSLLAFFTVDGVAVLFGSWAITILPLDTVKVVAGILFMVFGLLFLRSSPKKEKLNLSVRNAFFSGFAVILLSEWGDKTQLATAIFAAQYNPYLIFALVMSALGSVSFLAIYFGDLLRRYISPSLVHRSAAILFLLLGLSFLIF